MWPRGNEEAVVSLVEGEEAHENVRSQYARSQHKVERTQAIHTW